MESAPMTAAYSIIRDSNHPRAHNPSIEAEKHQDAARKFTLAKGDSEDPEARRMLSLLETHHETLSRVLKIRSERSASDKVQAQVQHGGVVMQSSTQQKDITATLPRRSTNNDRSTDSPLHTPSPHSGKRSRRELSSSIANNLATARGIPADRQKIAQQHSGSRLSFVAEMSQDNSTTASKSGDTTTKVSAQFQLPQRQTDTLSPTEIVSTSVGRRGAAESSATHMPERRAEDSFQKFYSTFEGLLSKLSAPLAFTGLPLSTEESKGTGDTTGGKRSELPNAPYSESGDVTRLFSRGTLRALKDERGGMPGMNESYFVVQTGGGTVPYASILTRDRQSSPQTTNDRILRAQTSNETDNDSEDPLQNKLGRPAFQERSSSNPKSLEELQVENDSLKQLTDNLSRRLYMWEKSSQSQTRALHQSIRMHQVSNPSIADMEGADDHTNPSTEEVRDLKRQLLALERSLESQRKESEKLKAVILRYRERWEKLKEGARSRRGGKDQDGPNVSS